MYGFLHTQQSRSWLRRDAASGSRVFRLRRLEPQRRIHLRAPLNSQAGLVDGLAVGLLGRLTFRAPERLRHFHQVVPVGLCHEAGQRRQLAALLLGEAGEEGAIGFDRTQNAHASAHVFIGKHHFWAGNVHGAALYVAQREAVPVRLRALG